jgi:hypothetical protein
MKRITPIMLALYVTLAQSAVAEKMGDWNIDIGPAGNEFYEPPLPPNIDAPEPSDAVLNWARTLTPDHTITRKQFKGDRTPPEFRVYVTDGHEEVRYYLGLDGKLFWMDYRDNRDSIRESPDAIIRQGDRYPINLNQVPQAMLDKLAAASPDTAPSKAWFADTLVGPRYIVQVGNLVFFGTPGGRIHGAGSTDSGLEEVSEHATLGPGEGLSLKDLSAKWGDQFNYTKLIKERLGETPENVTFRYIVMGDCRDQRDLLDVIVRHIDSLDPKPAFVIISGDAVRHGFADEYDSYYLPAIAQTDVPFFVAAGNHDVGIGGRAEEFRALFGEDSLNFYFDYGKSRFIFLDNCSVTTQWSDALAMGDRWLKDLPQGYRSYVSVHKPPATVKKWAYHAMSMEDSKPFSDLMTQHGVDEVYTGHIHAYSTATLGGVDYTLSGGAGAGLHGRFGPRGTVHHYVICDASPDGVKQQLVRFYKGKKPEDR